MLAAEGVQVSRGGRTLLQDARLTVHPGEVVAAIGPNGAGKSTLLHVLAGTTAPESGTAVLDGTPLAQWSRTALARRRAVLPQASQLAFPFRVEDVVMLGRTPHAGHRSRDADRIAANRALHAAGVGHLAGRTYTTLSGGERQRVQLARVFAQVWAESGARTGPPAYLLLDEPTNNLDIAHQGAIMASARRFAADGNGVLAVLHDPNLAAQHADRICVIHDGRVLTDGPPELVLTPAVFAEAFNIRATVMAHPNGHGPVVLPEG
jgi:iron complex transport system ATP-binding protein